VQKHEKGETIKFMKGFFSNWNNLQNS